MDRAHAAIVLTDESVLHVVGKLTESAFAFVSSTSPVSYTHLTLPTSDLV